MNFFDFFVCSLGSYNLCCIMTIKLLESWEMYCQTLCTLNSFAQYWTCLLESLYSYISELAQRQCHCSVIKQETPISSLAK